MDNSTVSEIDGLIEPSVDTTVDDNNIGDLLEDSVEKETITTRKGGDPNERFTKSPHNKVKEGRRKKNKAARKSRSQNRK